MVKMKLYITIFTLVGYVFSEEPPRPPPDPAIVHFYESSASRGTHSDFIFSAMEIILKDGVFEEEKQYIASKIPYCCPEQLSKKFDFKLYDSGTQDKDMLELMKQIFNLSPKPAHRYRLNKRIAGLDPLALAGDWMAATMSNLVVTYYVSPVWTIMEIEMTKYLSKNIGWKRSGDGVPTSGCGAANSMALAVAMIHARPELRDIGTFSLRKKSLVFASKHSSTSWQTAAIYQGLGIENIRLVDVDTNGQMDVKKLESALETTKNSNTEEAVMVVATAGTPVLGVIDNLDVIGDICKRYRVWYHVDAEKAGGYLFLNSNDELRKRLQGIQL